jgi:hypothetical protein
MDFLNALRCGGLLNTDSPDLSGLITQRMSTELVAFCTSRTCAVQAGRTIYSTSSTHKIEKCGVDQGKSNCPDCGHILFWKHIKR